MNNPINRKNAKEISILLISALFVLASVFIFPSTV